MQVNELHSRYHPTHCIVFYTFTVCTLSPDCTAEMLLETISLQSFPTGRVECRVGQEEKDV